MNNYVKKLFSLNDFCTHYMYMVDVWLETKAVGGFLNENRIFHNMYVLGNLLSKYEYMRTFCAYRVMINFDLITNWIF